MLFPSPLAFHERELMVLAGREKKPLSRSSRKASGETVKAQADGNALRPDIDCGSDAVFNVDSANPDYVEPFRNDKRSADGQFEPVSGTEMHGSADEPNRDVIPIEVFDEAGYLRLNPDVRDAIELGQFESGYAHYLLYGIDEGRRLSEMPREARNVMLLSIGDGRAGTSSMQIRCEIDSLLIAPNAGLMVVGWIDDAADPLVCVRIISSSWRVVIDASRILRVRRLDVEKALGDRAHHAYGLLGFLHFGRGGDESGPISIELWQQGGFATTSQCAARTVSDVELRRIALSHLASACFFGNPDIESAARLEHGVGAELVQFSRAISGRNLASPYVERFGARHKSPRGTIIVCLYGKADFYFLQNCLFAGLPGIDDYEFVYVCNSPELAETLLREAYSATLIYGLSSSIMILGGNAGFGGANNAAARIAASDRLLFVNPDVFPRDRDWARKHTALLNATPREQTRIFGIPLYYDDGSLMHGGMYFETDIGVSMASGTPIAQTICRVEHYGKGAPAESPQFTRPRPVPAVTGAFISVESSWFEDLGGFSMDFIFGHYEDADFCLRSMGRGVVPWLHDIRMWHLEGKGSTRQSQHEGGSMVNRWLFSRTWRSTIEADLKGPSPTHALLQPASSNSSASANREAFKNGAGGKGGAL